MARVKSTKISFQPSDSPDVVDYLLYVSPEDVPVDYDAPVWSIGLDPEVDLADLPGMTTMDGVYNIGITALDDAGNESSMSIAEGVALDFLAPNPPGAISIVRS